MGYLLPVEYIQYGLTAETTDDWITMASALMESYCRRPSLLVTQYVERIRLTAGSQTARLSYRPLAAAAGATSPLVGVQVRYGRPRRGELPDSHRAQIAWAFSLPGSWSALDINSTERVTVNGNINVQGDLSIDVNATDAAQYSALADLVHASSTAAIDVLGGNITAGTITLNAVSNLVLDVAGSGWTAAGFVEAAAERGVRIYPVSPTAVRLVWHLDVDDAGTALAVDALAPLLEQGAPAV